MCIRDSYKAGNGEWTTEAPSVTNVLEGTVTVSVKAVRSGYADLTTEDVTCLLYTSSDNW